MLGAWECTNCTFVNDEHMELCEQCFERKPDNVMCPQPGCGQRVYVNQMAVHLATVHVTAVQGAPAHGQVVKNNTIYNNFIAASLRLLNTLLVSWQIVLVCSTFIAFIYHGDITNGVRSFLYLLISIVLSLIISVIVYIGQNIKSKVVPIIYIPSLVNSIIICFILMILLHFYSEINQMKQDIADNRSWIQELDNNFMKFKELTSIQINEIHTMMNDNVKHFEKYCDDKYNNLLQTKPWVRKWDDFVLDTINVFAQMDKMKLRRLLGLGCFIEGTNIWIDKFGNYINVEQLENGFYVYNPVLNINIKINSVIGGYETGFVYNITTDNLLSIVVTKTHPMMIATGFNNSIDINSNINIAAKDVRVGNYTWTVNGIEKIISIEKIKVENTAVYNFMFDESEMEMNAIKSIISRAVIANGVYTLDLKAQMSHE